MPEYKVINDLQLVFFTPGEVSTRPAAKVTGLVSNDTFYFHADEIRIVGEWLIECANKADLSGYESPFMVVASERESLADDTQAEREMAQGDEEPCLPNYDYSGDMRAIPFDGQPVPYETDDNISPAELGLF